MDFYGVPNSDRISYVKLLVGFLNYRFDNARIAKPDLSTTEGRFLSNVLIAFGCSSRQGRRIQREILRYLTPLLTLSEDDTNATGFQKSLIEQINACRIPYNLSIWETPSGEKRVFRSIYPDQRPKSLYEFFLGMIGDFWEHGILFKKVGICRQCSKAFVRYRRGQLCCTGNCRSDYHNKNRKINYYEKEKNRKLERAIRLYKEVGIRGDRLSAKVKLGPRILKKAGLWD